MWENIINSFLPIILFLFLVLAIALIKAHYKINNDEKKYKNKKNNNLMMF